MPKIPWKKWDLKNERKLAQHTCPGRELPAQRQPEVKVEPLEKSTAKGAGGKEADELLPMENGSSGEVQKRACFLSCCKPEQD